MVWLKKVWILISWLHQKPADLDLHFFYKNGMAFWKIYAHSSLIRLIRLIIVMSLALLILMDYPIYIDTLWILSQLFFIK